MIKGFEGYYDPDFDKLWNEAVFVFDANVLLDLFRYSENTRNELLDILTNLKDRIWIPYQFMYEYHRNKMTVGYTATDEYGESKKQLEKCNAETRKQLHTLEESLQKLKNRTRVEIDAQIDKVDAIFDEIRNQLTNSRDQHESSLNADSLEQRIAQLFAENYGSPYEDDDERLKKVRKVAKERLARGEPPGSSKDSKKDYSDPDGDLIGWFQIMDYATESEKPIVLVTNDNDWYLRHGGRTIGPHPHLRQEMYDKAGVDCYIYKTDEFMKHARDKLDAEVSEETIVEAESREKYMYKYWILENSEERTAADISANYMTQVEELLREDQPDQYEHVSAAVLCGAVIEDALRRLCDRQIPPVATYMPSGRPKAISAIIRDLQNANVFNNLIAQQLRWWVQVRNWAVHGRFDRFSRDDVDLMLEGTRNLLADYL